MHSSNLYSHPDRLLEDHLIGVSKFSELFLKEKPQKIKEPLDNIIKIIALSHDIGKATGYFQEYLKANNKDIASQKSLTKHSLFSAICSYYLSKEIKTDNELFPFFAFLTVKRHHGNLKDVLDDVIFDTNDANILRKQCESINENNLIILAEKLYEEGLPLFLSKKLLKNWIDDFVKESNLIKKKLRRINSAVSNFIILNLLYSLLLDADKSDVVIRDISTFERYKFISANMVDEFKARSVFPYSPLNNLREKAYQEAINNSININEKIYSINLPTGLGKTLSSFSFALRLREKIGLNHRIVYALPFLSIIDQNYNVFEHVIRRNGIEPDTSCLLKHHHLSEIFYKKEDNEFEPEEAKIFIEGWNAEIIITTFVQLFHTLVSNRNKSIRKFHRLANSIIILDEVQSIPIKYWLLLKNVLVKLSEMLNTYIIFITATQPLIFEQEEIKGLVNSQLYFSVLDRILMKPLLEKNMSISELCEHFNLNDGKTYLFIFNTINSAKEFYNLIKDKEIPITYLSTHVTPKERLKRINKIIKGKCKVLISTQLVEAGVDIDFDIVVRDLAPLDSINQAAGRCNRNGKHKGEVYIVSLKDGNDRLYCSYIYDPVLLDITQKILSSRKEIRENEFLQLINEYYRETKNKKSQYLSRRFLEAIIKLKYDRDEDDKTKISISDFKLIEEDYAKKDVFIEVDDEAQEIWQQYINIKNMKDLFKRKRLFDKIKADFYQYVVSIPTNIKNMPPMFGELGYVNKTILRDYYDSETGFITKDPTTLIIW